jgi:hypothetical protein
MPHIRPDCVEQSATRFPFEHRRKPNSLAVRLTRDVLLLRSAGSSRRAIAAALNLSQRRVQTILDGAAPAAPSERRPFVMRERNADYVNVEAALRAGSTLRAEHVKYATSCPAPYSFTSFWRRFEDWLESQPDRGSRWDPRPRSALRGNALFAPMAKLLPSFGSSRRFAFPQRTHATITGGSTGLSAKRVATRPRAALRWREACSSSRNRTPPCKSARVRCAPDTATASREPFRGGDIASAPSSLPRPART